MKGLFINSPKLKDSIHESGYMAYQCLLLSNKYSLDYIEIDINSRQLPLGYDFYFFNYHVQTMGWLGTNKLKKLPGFVITMVLEVSPGNPFAMCSPSDFEAYCVLDPTIKRKNNVYPFPRPLEKISFTPEYTENPVPVIGTFGFATKGKGFQHVVDAVNKEFEEAIVKINIPHGDFVPNSKEYALFLGNICKDRAKPGIDVVVTHDFLSKTELIKWCASNTLNCFLYDRNMPGLAATTDQAIVSNRPLSVSNNDTFRHITSYITPYPECSLKKSIENSLPLVKKMQEDWGPEKFAMHFEEVLTANERWMLKKKRTQSSGSIELPLKKFSLYSFFEKRWYKYKNKGLKKMFSRHDSKYNKEII